MASAGTMVLPPSGIDLGFGVGDATLLLRPREIAALVAAINNNKVKNVASLCSLPNELVIEIFMSLPISDVLTLSQASKRFHNIYLGNRANIVLEALTFSQSGFSPVESLLRTATVSPTDLVAPGGIWLEKDIVFKGKVLYAGNGGSSATACLGDADISRILKICKAVKGWERLFPHYRFSHHPEQLRKLASHEAERLRSALYTWMRYSFYFHGDLPRPSPFAPSRGDMRCKMIRVLSSGEEAELKDLWLTVKDAVRSLCPSVTAVRHGVESNLPEEQAARIAWGGNSQENDLVVSTMLKLGPERLLHYIEHRHEYGSKARLIREIREEAPGIESDVESLSDALDVVYWERHAACSRLNMPAPPTPLAEYRDPDGGILDWGALVEPLRGIIKAGFGLGWTFDGDGGEEEEDADGDGDEEVREVPAGSLEP